MTDEQRRRLHVLSRGRLLPGSWDKRFIIDMHCKPDDFEPSPRQAELIDRLYHRYRRQHKEVPV
jgi:hypothetical protein